MKTVRMSRAALEVSELCFGTLTLGTLQANLSPQEGAKAIRRALELGITTPARMIEKLK
jgi:aryl-alcohol dehydrogenase-like predicted oxidoreductase